MDDSLRCRIEQVRASLEAMADGALVGWVGPPRTAIPDDVVALLPVAEFLRVADGAQAGEFILFRADGLTGTGPHEGLPGGVGRWLTVGRNHVWWLALDRQTFEVSELDADGAAEVVRHLGPYDRLVRELFGPGYLRLSHGLGAEWDALLRGFDPLPPG